MTKEELEKEAEKSLDKRLGTYAYIRKQDCYTNYVDGYIDSAEPREKRIAELEQENADLKEEVNKVAFENGELKEENAELKKEWQEQVQKATDEGYARTLQTIQLTKAKELLKKVVTDFHNMDCVTVHIDKTIAEAEQFIKDSEGK